MSRDILIDIKNVSKYYDDGQIMALENINLSIKNGEILFITGPSGSGKSTLLYLIGGLDTPTNGEIVFDGKLMKNALKRKRFRLENIGFVFQMFYLWPTLNVYENVFLPLIESKLTKVESHERVTRLIKTVGLENKLYSSVTKLSFGERQRVAIARSLIMNPSVVLADEPTGNLDTRNKEIVFDLFKQINNDHGVTIILVTHDRRAYAFSDRIIEINDGRLQLP